MANKKKLMEAEIAAKVSYACWPSTRLVDGVCVAQACTHQICTISRERVDELGGPSCEPIRSGQPTFVFERSVCMYRKISLPASLATPRVLIVF